MVVAFVFLVFVVALAGWVGWHEGYQARAREEDARRRAVAVAKHELRMERFE